MRLTAEGLQIAVRATPKAGRDALAGCRADGAGGAALLVRVTAVPEKGKANAAVRRLLAKALRVAPGSLELLAGETDRNKTWRVPADTARAAGLTEAEALRRLGLAPEAPGAGGTGQAAPQ
ncbi:MAG: DUF167 domain-containing protein [Sneathiellaceae bacterium]